MIDTNIENNKTEPTGEPVVKETNPITKETEVKPIVFSELSPEIQRFIDQERTKASKTARENAVKDPTVIAKVKQEVEQEATLSAEEKYAKKLSELSIYENKLEATEKLRDTGLNGEDISQVIDLLVSSDKDKTLLNTQKFIDVFKLAVEKNVSVKMQENLKNTFKPKTPISSTKAFKDMDYNERLELQKTNPAQFKKEAEAFRQRI